MGAVASSPIEDEKDRNEPPHPCAAEAPVDREALSVNYQVILRHLAKFREGATAVLDLFARQAPVAEDQALPVAPAPTISQEPEAEPKSLLERRIVRHMSKVDQALRQIASLNPESSTTVELPPEVRIQLLIIERTIHDIVGAELHFWAAIIENRPLEKFDEVEQAWIRWIIRLANIIGVDATHKEHLTFLEDRAPHEHA